MNMMYPTYWAVYMDSPGQQVQRKKNLVLAFFRKILSLKLKNSTEKEKDRPSSLTHIDATRLNKIMSE